MWTPSNGMRRAFLSVLGLCALYPAASTAAVPTRDAAATRDYLRAEHADELAVAAAQGASRADLEARAGDIADECPGALAYAPRDEAFGLLSEEIQIVVSFAGVAPERSALLRTSKAIGHLRWSNSRLTRLVHRLAAEERGDAMVVLPDVCAQISAWKSSAYVALPASAGRFLAISEAIEADRYFGPSEEIREAAILRMLEPYETPADRRTAEQVRRLEAQIDESSYSVLSAAAKKLGKALGASSL
jgi:hypothetical protein